ncbi:hypothetical protein CSIM01_08907 [Colletotrichum simmondsii]|uniref:AA1-like domain-containing protein n=1 Tax=Colletotrichum simmondsii TaxID=703756 RepID=A0A135SHF5_9PEZI|nr:hypothetical protein CSIM01_08907 [Colletotrichum simmondsii]
MQIPASLSFFAILGMVSAAAECPRSGGGDGPYLHNKYRVAPTRVGQTNTYDWAGTTISVKMQKSRDSCDPEGDCDDDITYNFKNRGTKSVRVRIEESYNDFMGLVLAPGADCDLNRYFTRGAGPYQISFAN